LSNVEDRELTGARAEELDHRAMAGGGSDPDARESLHLVWRAYFAPWTAEPALAAPSTISVLPYAGGFASLLERLPGPEAALPGVPVPAGLIAGGQSPMPVDGAAAATVARLPGAWLEVLDGAGHSPWVERPGGVRAGLERLAAG
jgi:pimeloyl-ACP methyl ester carboxylesterase